MSSSSGQITWKPCDHYPSWGNKGEIISRGVSPRQNKRDNTEELSVLCRKTNINGTRVPNEQDEYWWINVLTAVRRDVKYTRIPPRLVITPLTLNEFYLYSSPMINQEELSSWAQEGSRSGAWMEDRINRPAASSPLHYQYTIHSSWLNLSHCVLDAYPEMTLLKLWNEFQPEMRRVIPFR